MSVWEMEINIYSPFVTTQTNMAALGRVNFPKAVREIRLHLCQTSKSSQGVRYKI